MGGNLVKKMGGEDGDSPPGALKGVCAVCPAIDLAASAGRLQRRDNFFYQRHFVTGLMARYGRKAKLFPGRDSENGFGRIRTVREFDDAITAPQFRYPDAHQHYDT